MSRPSQHAWSVLRAHMIYMFQEDYFKVCGWNWQTQANSYSCSHSASLNLCVWPVWPLSLLILSHRVPNYLLPSPLGCVPNCRVNRAWPFPAMIDNNWIASFFYFILLFLLLLFSPSLSLFTRSLCLCCISNYFCFPQQTQIYKLVRLSIYFQNNKGNAKQVRYNLNLKFCVWPERKSERLS